MFGFISPYSVAFGRVGYEKFRDGRLKKALGLTETEVTRRAVAI